MPQNLKFHSFLSDTGNMKYTYIDIQFPVCDVSKVILFEAMIRLGVKVRR